MNILCIYDDPEPNLPDVFLTVRDNTGAVLVARQNVPALNAQPTRYQVDVSVPDGTQFIVEDWDADGIAGITTTPRTIGFPDVSPIIDFQPTIEAPIVNPTPVTVDGGFDSTARTHLMALENADLSTLPDDVAALRDDVSKLGKAQLVVMSPVLASGNARITRGGDYYASEGRSLDFELTGPVVMAFRERIASVEFIVEEHGAFDAGFENIENGVLVRVELSRAQTAAFTQSSAKLFVRATLGDGRKIPLLSGLLTIEDGGE